MVIVKNRLLLGIACTLPLLTTGLPTKAQSLEEALATAIDNNPILHERYARYRSVLEQQGEVSSEYLPQVSLRAAVGPERTKYSSGQAVDEDLVRDELGLRISQLLFNGFETTANSDRLNYEASSERLQLIAEAEDLTLKVCEAYLNTRKAEVFIDLTEQHVRAHIEILEDVKRLTQSGFANEADIAQVSSRLANARSSLVAAKNNYQDSAAVFLRLIGRPPADLVDPVADTSLLPTSIDEAIRWAKEAHPQLKAAQSDIKAAKEEVRASQSGYYPRVSLEGYADKGHDIGGFEGRDEDYRLMLVLEYDLYNGGRDSSRSKSSNWRYNEALSVRDTTELDLAEGTRLSWNAYHSLIAQESLLRQSVDASTLAETAYITQYKLGKRSLLDVLNAKVEVFLARKNYLEAKYDQDQAAFRLLNSTGRLTYALRVSYPDEWQNTEDSQ